jgi:prepilin-type N-terminal cleavage/methylation domain-containing protein
MKSRLTSLCTPGMGTASAAAAQRATLTQEVIPPSNVSSHPQRGSGPQRSGFTLVEMLVVIAVIAVLAGLVVGLTSRTSSAARENKIKVMRDQLVTAIESYHAHFGFYPPDNLRRLPTREFDSLVNPLFYELTGTVVDNVQGHFRSPDYGDVLTSQQLMALFNLEGFANASPDPRKVRKFIELRSEQFGLLNQQQPELHVLAVPVRWPKGVGDLEWPLARRTEFVPEPGLNPWRYISSNPTNNPGRFDLWAEFVDGRTVRMISNWHRDIVDRP